MSEEHAMGRVFARLPLLGIALAIGAPAVGADCGYLRELTLTASLRPVAELEALLAKGLPAEPPAECNVTHSPLEAAAQSGRADSVRVLLAHGASTRRATLWAANQQDDPELLGTLIDATPAERRDDALSDGLDGAATRGHTRAIAALLARGAKPARAGHFALEYAAAAGHAEAVRLLATGFPAGDARIVDAGLRVGASDLVRRAFAAGADPHAEDAAGANALSKLAAATSASRSAADAALARELLAMGVDPNRPLQGKRPLTLARENGSAALVTALEGAGAREGSTLGHKLGRIASGLKAAGLAVLLLLGGKM